ncbi:G-type lectin S-receptor-like serine/threonine-protein kinase At5g35370 [Rhododendron vialii]|uniref:G-type lectin S-receptor-like serine/threonine-protein kinase At5g35370 n=1 Tax=Rhododendron vialii TaxID=182163 RepID=UPI00265EDB0A|nr:G-type lectin S-receptor-like serine/threonine-protein kinase At5g35370 [Rhododendron vialii]
MQICIYSEDLAWVALNAIHSPIFRNILWSAYRSSPSDANIRFSPTGIHVQDGDGKFVWSTPPLRSPVDLFELQDSGNLVLRDQFDRSLWESFDYPTDTIVFGQRLPVGQSLVSAISEVNLSMGDYQFTLTGDGGSDVVMTWKGLTYWKLSMDTRTHKLSNLPASYMVMNETGLFLVGGNSSVVVVQLALGVSKFRIAKLEYNGRFSIKNYDSSKWVEEFSGPVDDCRIPYICGKIGVCYAMPVPAQCSCPPGFHVNNDTNDGCSTVYDSYSLPSACNASGNDDLKVPTSYMKLGDGMDYSLNDFSEPRVRGVNLSGCEHLCSMNCSCLGLFHDNSSGSCYLLENLLGSIIANSTTDRMGYIKALHVSTFAGPYGKNDSRRNQLFPIAGLVLLPSFVFLLITLVVVGIVCSRKWKSRNSSIELEIDGIPGLPVRFGYKELVVATENFRTKIGSGGFGTVYKGMLPDESVVAVKKITSLGVEGKREFCTEIAIIGNIRHVNLVRLKGFCARGRQRFLVYEYMNRGSLDRVLFGNGYVLEWEERFKIAIGTARGLAYLHSSCEQKIIHCDVKPENILLDDNLQVKISDFGISKLLSREQSGLFTTMRGTRGYVAPDWLSNSPITDKSDVYSYGMVLLEIVRGRKNWSLQIHNGDTENDQSSSPSGLEHSIFFPLFALEMHKQRRYLELVDPRLEGRVTSEAEVEKLIRVALCCVHQDPALRPSMANVVGMLEGGYPVGVPRVESLSFLPFFDQRRTEVPRIEAHNEQNGLVLVPQANANSNSRSRGSHNTFSYMSSQQVSGPR